MNKAMAISGMTKTASRRPDAHFWRGRRVLVTGHTGFKGAWLCLMLEQMGAKVLGFALPAEDGPSAFRVLGIQQKISHETGDIRNMVELHQYMANANPDIVLHLAAQAFVSRSYQDPVGTFASNVTGTQNLLEALRGSTSCHACVIVTSDKVYRNDHSGHPFAETDPLGGADPYSASKAACEIVVASYAASFGDSLPALATARAGNVIGGGDFGANRLIPDLVRAEKAGTKLVIRQPDATRPFQHVLDVLSGYLLLAQCLASSPKTTPSALNFGPHGHETSVRNLLAAYGAARVRPVDWVHEAGHPMKEAARLALDSSLARKTLGFEPVMEGQQALQATAQWYDLWMRGEDVLPLSCTHMQHVLAGP